jgi:hypothetical protein
VFLRQVFDQEIDRRHASARVRCPLNLGKQVHAAIIMIRLRQTRPMT